MSDGELRILLVVEADADARTVSALVDRVLLEGTKDCDWLDESWLPTLRRWVGYDEPQADDAVRCVTWKDLKQVRPRVLGFGGRTAHPYALAARGAIATAANAPSKPTAVVLVVDADSQPDRLRGLDEGRAMSATDRPVVIGVANPKREAWVLNALACCNSLPARWSEVRAKVGFDPGSEAHRLRGSASSERDIKGVLASVIAEPDEERRALASADFEALATKCHETGLSAFIGEVGDRLVPVLRRAAGAARAEGAM